MPSVPGNGIDCGSSVSVSAVAKKWNQQVEKLTRNDVLKDVIYRNDADGNLLSENKPKNIILLHEHVN